MRRSLKARQFAILFWAFFLMSPAIDLHPQSLLINEIMSSNGATLSDEDGDYPDWLELYNPGPAPVDLTGYGLSDQAKNLFKWRFQTGSVETRGFLLVFASGKDRQPDSSRLADFQSIPGMSLWLRSDQVNTNSSTEVRRSGNRYFVQRWADQSGLNRHANQTASAQQPEWIAGSAETGLGPMLRFDGVDDSVTIASAPGQNDFCLIAVVRPTTAHEIDQESSSGVGGVAGQRYLFGAAHGGDRNAGAGVSVGTNGISVYEHGSSYMPALAVYQGAIGPGWVLASVNYQSRRPTIYLQGIQARAGLSSPRPLISAPMQIGAGAYGSFRGDVAEIIFYARSLEDSERRAVEGYLARKYRVGLRQRFHTNFSLDSNGEQAFLTRPDGVIADRFPSIGLPRDLAFGRKPDGQAEMVFFSHATPGAPNASEGFRELLGAPQFFAGGGFYTASIALTVAVTNEGATVRYTLDGSEPTEKSAIYTGPLTISSLMGTPNNLSLIPTAPGWQAPATEVFKGTVVRARAFKPGALASAVTTHTYWVTARGRARYSLPVLSLSTSRSNFFDSTIGIYVAGKAPGGNYSQRGPEWERPVHVEFFETNGQRAFGQEAGVKIHGNTSQNFPIKGLDVDAHAFRGTTDFRHRIFPARPRTAFRHFLLRPAGHDYSMAFMRDPLMQSFVAPLGVETQAARAAVVFLNGEYWGVHYLQEKEDGDFVESYGAVQPGEYDYLEGYAAAREGDTRQYEALLAFLNSHDLANGADYAQLERMIELPNYIIYKAAEIFNYRWDIGNHRLWRARGEGARWRWIHFDNDVGWGGFWAEQPAWQFDMLEAVTQPSGSLHDHNNETTTFLLRRLLLSPAFRREFINDFADLLNTTFHPAQTVERINEMTAVLDPEMQEHVNRWRAPGSVASWKASVQYLRDFASRRPAAVRQHIIKKFGLRGTATLTLAQSGGGHGTLQLNSLSVGATPEKPWAGIYFKDNPVVITARPKPGYRFAGWSGVPGLEGESLTLSLNGDASLTAWFEPDPLARPIFTGAQWQGDYLRIVGKGLPGLVYDLQVSTNFLDWGTRQAATADANGIVDLFTSPGGWGATFYRLALP